MRKKGDMLNAQYQMDGLMVFPKECNNNNSPKLILWKTFIWAVKIPAIISKLTILTSFKFIKNPDGYLMVRIITTISMKKNGKNHEYKCE